MQKPNETSRRHFLRSAAATGAGVALFNIIPRHVLGGPGKTAPSDTITQATIGCGGQGMGAHVQENKEGATPVQLAVCDVDKKRLDNAMKKAARSCEGYGDWRKVIERKDVDVVHIATPPHWHALIAIAACQAGKDVYCEKPMTKYIAEGQALIKAVRGNGRIFTINNYGRGGWEKYRKLVASGLLGTPVTARLYPDDGFNWKVKEWSGRTNQPPEPVPENLDYDMWLGPAPVKPYFAHRTHGSFRGYWDYDGGGMSDMGQHWFDPVQYVLGKDDTGPVEIEAYAPWPSHPDAVGMWGKVHYKYADGTQVIFESREWGDYEKEQTPFLEGSNGKVWRNDTNRCEPASLWEQLKHFPEPPRLIGFDEALRNRVDPSVRPCVEASHRSISVIHLGNIAIRTGRKLNWDPVAEQFIGDAEANRLVNEPMRAPWHL